MRRAVRCFAVLVLCWSNARADDGNRLTYLDGSDPYYVSREFPKLTTPQWVGEEGVEAVVVLAIDDMRGMGEQATAGLMKYENYLRPILDRLKRIDGRAPVSIMTNHVDPQHPHLQKWLKEGVSLECHTYDHPCPLLKDGDFAKSKGTYDRCADLMFSIPGNRPVAFRMPCCDSLNTVSPRFYAEIFNKTTPDGKFLTIDTSVFHVTTSNDPALPRELVIDPDGRDKFLKYVPTDRSFVNTIFDYPYPYVIGRLCWEFPCAAPSDWSAQHRHRPFNPDTVRDWKAALDATVLKQGVFNLVFHPHGWIRNVQIVELIEHAIKKHGKKVKFLAFAEAESRLNEHLLRGEPLRAADGRDNGVRLLDVNGDGYMDVLIGNEKQRLTRIWDPGKRSWIESPSPAQFVKTDSSGIRRDAGARFGIFDKEGRAAMLILNDSVSAAWRFDGSSWIKAPELLRGLEHDGEPILAVEDGRDSGLRLRDLDGDGVCELVAGSAKRQAVFQWSPTAKRWKRLPFVLPPGASVVDAKGRDAGLRFVDFNDDGRDDVVFSNEERYALALWTSLEEGWSQTVLAGKGDGKIPPITRFGTNNGAWFHSRTMWVQNEDVARLPNLVDRRTFNNLLKDAPPKPKSPRASLKALRARPGFRVELVAAEPLVMDPVAFDWGPDGKLWVVEMADYPSGVDGKGKFGGRVRFLEDRDGDGRYEHSEVFLDGLGFPNGVAAWRNGVLVSCAPDIFYAEDTDGDGKADLKRKLFVGFTEANQQHRMNGFRWGLDNWLYCGGDQNETNVRVASTGRKVLIGRRDFRIRPDRGLIEPQTGQTQFTRTRDDWGNWFGCHNSDPCFHFALADHYLRRNPHMKTPSPKRSISVTPGAAPVFPRSRTLARFNDHNKVNR
ncbi:MAG: polysaccharide deacetylase family protein, partial [Planctomycetales bacterium]